MRVENEDGLTALADFWVATLNQEQAARSVLASAIAALPGHKRPRWVHWVPALPLKAIGNLQRALLAALHGLQRDKNVQAG